MVRGKNLATNGGICQAMDDETVHIKYQKIRRHLHFNTKLSYLIVVYDPLLNVIQRNLARYGHVMLLHRCECFLLSFFGFSSN